MRWCEIWSEHFILITTGVAVVALATVYMVAGV